MQWRGQLYVIKMMCAASPLQLGVASGLMRRGRGACGGSITLPFVASPGISNDGGALGMAPQMICML
jgi:hypothetical protein